MRGSSCKLKVRIQVFLLYFPELCYSCVFHKTSRSTTFFLITRDETQGLELVRASSTHHLVQTICESVMNWLNSNKAEYFVQSLFCTCQLIKLTDKRFWIITNLPSRKWKWQYKGKCLMLNLDLQRKKMHGHISSVLQV